MATSGSGKAVKSRRWKGALNETEYETLTGSNTKDSEAA